MSTQKQRNSGVFRRQAGALVRPHIARIAGYIPGEQPTDRSFVKLNTNENPYPASAEVRAAIADSCSNLELYPDPTARELREYAAHLYGVDAEGILVGNGSDELLSIVLRATVAPGEGVAYPVPTYSYYDTLVALQGARGVQVPFPAHYGLPAELATSEARLIIVCNPNAPSGTTVPTSAIEELARARPDTVVLVDEAYVDFADQNALGLVGRLGNVVLLRTLSKSYSLAGLRVGLAFTSGELAAELHKVRDSYNVSRLAQAGALAALRDQPGFQQHVAQVRATRTRLTHALGELGFDVLPSSTNFVLARRPGENLAGLCASLRERKILVRYFEELADAIRISVGTDEQIDSLLAALGEIDLTAR